MQAACAHQHEPFIFSWMSELRLLHLLISLTLAHQVVSPARHINSRNFKATISGYTGTGTGDTRRHSFFFSEAQAFSLTNFILMLPTLTSGISKQSFFFLDLDSKSSLLAHPVIPSISLTVV